MDTAHRTLEEPRIERRQLAEGVVWTLPPRNLPLAFRAIGFVFGVLPPIIVACLAWQLGPLGGRLVGGFGPQAALAGTAGLTALIAIIGLLVIWKVVRFVLAVAFGRTEVRLDRDRLISRERIGPGGLLGWTRSRPAARVAFLEVSSGTSEGDKAPEWIRSAAGLAARLDDREGEKWPVALGLPAPVLRELAAELSQHLGIDHDPEAPGTLGDTGELDDDIEFGRFEQPDGVPQPPGSDAAVVRTDGEVSIRLPAMGLMKGSKGLFGFSVCWLGFCALFVGVGGFMLGGSRVGATDLLGAGFIILIVSVFVLIGVWTMCTSISMGRRRTIIDLVGDAVLITRKSPFSQKIEQWTADQVESIGVGPSGTSVNDVPILELQIHTIGPDGTRGKVGMLGERPNAELRWIASEIRAAMGLETPVSAENEPRGG